MALDPTTTGGGIGGWGLAPIGTPSQSTAPLPLRAPSQLTPEQIAMLRQNAMALQEPPKQNIQSWTQGVAELVKAIQGNREADFARQQEAQGRQAGAAAQVDMVKGLLSQGGSPSPAAGTAADSGSGSTPASPGPSVANSSPIDGPTPSAGAAPAGTLGSGPAGATTADASAPRGIRNNNPLNIEDGDFAKSQPGYVGGDGRFAQFATADHGVAAANTLIDTYQTKHGLNTIAGIVSRWAPSTDGNNTQAYAADVAARMGIGPNDPIPPGMRDKLITAMAQHENGRPLTTASAAPPAAPTGLLAPIQPPPAAAPVPAAPAPSRPMAYAEPTPAAALPPEIAQGASNPMVDAIAGRSAPAVPPADFARQAAIMANRGAPVAPNVPVQTLSPPEFARQAAMMANGGGAQATPPAAAPGAPPIAPADFARQAAALIPPPPTMPPTTTQAQPIPPDVFARQVAAIAGGAAPAANPAVASPAPVPTPQPRPAAADAPSFLPTGSAIPGAVGPTSVNGAPLVAPGTVPGASAALPPAVGSTSTNGQPLIQPRQPAPSVAPMVSAIAGRPIVPASATAPAAGVQVAQNGMPTSAVPAPSGMRPAQANGLPNVLTSPTAQITPQQLQTLLANPWVPQETKAQMLNMIQQRGQVQTLPMEGGILQYDASGRRNWIPQTVYKEYESNGTKMQLEGTRAGPNEPMVWNPVVPGAGGSARPGEPDYSTQAGRDAIAAASAAAKKGAETGAETSAKYYDAVHRGLAGSGMIAAQQKQNIDALRQIAASPDFVSGTFKDVALPLQRLAASLGQNQTGAAPRELFNQLAAKVLADQFSGLKSMASETGEVGARIFAPMLLIEEKANITADDSTPGINAKLNLLDHAGNLMMRYADMADDYIKEHGRLDAGFDKAIRKEIAGSRLPNVVPQAGSAAPSAAAVPPSAIDALKANPDKRDEFDAKYGVGSSNSVLGAPATASPISR